jgi:uncharacterized protein YndB with AHSA1/START domain
VTIEVPSEKVHKVITSNVELKKWFSKDITVKDDKIKMAFGPGYHVFQVMENDDKKVVWKVIETKGPDEKIHNEMKAWDDTIITFNLEEKKLERLKGKLVTILHFRHEGLPAEDAFYADCNYHWGYFLHSLKNVAEGKKGWAM